MRPTGGWFSGTGLQMDSRAFVQACQLEGGFSGREGGKGGKEREWPGTTF